MRCWMTPVFFAPFAPYFHPVLRRPSTPVECYLRLMFFKFRHRLGYESLCAEVTLMCCQAASGRPRSGSPPRSRRAGHDLGIRPVSNLVHGHDRKRSTWEDSVSEERVAPYVHTCHHG
jgi:hypothetical protein